MLLELEISRQRLLKVFDGEILKICQMVQRLMHGHRQKDMTTHIFFFFVLGRMPNNK
jgi:hypothetical protein